MDDKVIVDLLGQVGNLFTSSLELKETIDFMLKAASDLVACDAASSVAAARLWWMLTDAGHHDVRVLTVGFAAWMTAALPVDSGPASPVVNGTFVVFPGQGRQFSAARVLEMLAYPPAPLLLDVRAAERYSAAP